MVYYWSPQQTQPQQQRIPTAATREESYIENILRLNRGKVGTFYFSFDNMAKEGSTRVVRGYVEAAGRDHVILREAKSDHRFLLPMIYFDYAEFDEELDYFNQG
jgi:spore germination protein Q